MAHQRPGVLMRMWTNFKNSLFQPVTRKVVGKDHHGNVYYLEHSTAEERNKKVHRGYLPGSAKNWEALPVEWEAWLRGRRSEIPTQEEIDHNSQQKELVQHRVKELDEKFQQEKMKLQKEEELLSPKQSDRLKQAKLPDIKSDYVDSSKEGEKAMYPKYKEFEDIPGTKYDRNDPKKDPRQ